MWRAAAGILAERGNCSIRSSRFQSVRTRCRICCATSPSGRPGTCGNTLRCRRRTSSFGIRRKKGSRLRGSSISTTHGKQVERPRSKCGKNFHRRTETITSSFLRNCCKRRERVPKRRNGGEAGKNDIPYVGLREVPRLATRRAGATRCARDFPQPGTDWGFTKGHVMPLIKKAPTMVSLAVKIEEPVKQLLEDSARFIESTPDHVVNIVIKKNLQRDQDYRRWREQ